MPQQQEFIPKHYQRESSNNEQAIVSLRSTDSLETPRFTFEVLRDGLFRTRFFSDQHPLPPFPSDIRPEPDGEIVQHIDTNLSRTFQSNASKIKATVTWEETPIVTLSFEGKEPLHSDLPFRSYVFDGPGVAHYTRYDRGSLHMGLGEKAAPLDLSNRHFTLSATDSFGYDVHRTDPLYKHIPLLIRASPKGVVGLFSTSHARGYYSVGSEMDGLWGFYKVYRQDYGGLEQYLIVGKTLQEVVRLYAAVVGFPLLVPRWGLGYLAGGMRYSMLDDPPAREALMEFADKLSKHNIPCSGFQMSSGYTVSETPPKTRNVFTWNRHRFPDPKGFCDAFHRRGIRLIANIKPYVLASHPEYDRLVEEGAFIIDSQTQKAGIARLWSAGGGESGEGGHLDFTSSAGYNFWYEGVKGLRAVGMDCMWNDNNEYVIAHDDWTLALDTVPRQTPRKDIGLWGRALHTELMGRASHDALCEVAPHERPFVLTRSATAGTMRYACSSWSGDNITSWAGMRGANALSLGAGMCGLMSYGHDIGGFEGPQPSPELLLRWIQLGIHSPRFAINCFKTGNDNSIGDVIEPWMYPGILPLVRKALQRRYELIPYLYSLMLSSHLEALPPQRWVGWGYERDAEVWSSRVLRNGEEQYWLGSSLMIGGVYEPGVREGRVYLPKQEKSDAGFLNTNAPFQYLPAGAWYSIASDWKDSIPVLARVGGAVPVGRPFATVAPGDRANEAQLPADDWRGLEIFPSPEKYADGRWFHESWREDDGISPPPVRVASCTISYAATPEEVQVDFRCNVQQFRPVWFEHGLTVILPVGDLRRVVAAGEHISVQECRMDGRVRRRAQLQWLSLDAIHE